MRYRQVKSAKAVQSAKVVQSAKAVQSLDLSAKAVLKRFDRGHKSAGAYLLEGEVVKKVYDLGKSSHKRRFQIEVAHLRHLSGCRFVPKLLHVDDSKGEIYMTYCGETPERTKANLDENRRLVKKLYKKWGLARMSKSGKPVFRTDLQNTAVMNDEMSLLDFGSSNWKNITGMMANLG